MLEDVFINKHEGKSDCVILYSTQADDPVPQADGTEISEAKFFSPSELPLNAAGSVHRRLAGESINGAW